MARPLVSDLLWARVEPLLPPPKPHPQGGRPPIPNRAALTGVLFVLKTGIPWEDLPQEMGCGSGMTCWRRLRDWQECGVWDRLHRLLLDELRAAGKLDLSRGTVDSSSVRAVGGGEKTGPNPTDRRKLGSKHHVLTDAGGIPLKTTLTGANRHDSTQLLTLVDESPTIGGKPGPRPQHPRKLYGDRAYDSEPHRQELRNRHIEPHLAKRNEPHGSGLGVFRWFGERTIAWLHNKFRRLRLRFDRRSDIHEAWLSLGDALICFQTLTGQFC